LIGYIFESEFIFTDYVDSLYNIKVNSSKNSARYAISKLLLNTLYGRFGMNPDMMKHTILSHEDALNYYNKYDVASVITLNTGKELISYNSKDSCNNDDNSLTTLNISIPISAAITAYARMIMTEYKQNYNIYYTDTDSIFMDKPLNPDLVGNELGQMKLEHIFDRIVFTHKILPLELNITSSNIHFPPSPKGIDYNTVFNFKFSGYHLPGTMDFTK